jgi:hypothetical protein
MEGARDGTSNNKKLIAVHSWLGCAKARISPVRIERRRTVDARDDAGIDGLEDDHLRSV